MISFAMILNRKSPGATVPTLESFPCEKDSGVYHTGAFFYSKLFLALSPHRTRENAFAEILTAKQTKHLRPAA